MDQNTNNSFTSAPQGGDFSDIIIPNAYAAKPKGKNLKKYIIFGLIGLVALFLISLIAKAIFVDSKTMSRQEFIQFAESEDMNNIEWLENYLITIKNGGLSFDLVFSDQYYKEIIESRKNLNNIKAILSQKSSISGNASIKKNYVNFVSNFNQRYDSYNNALSVYDDFYQAYKDLNLEILSKYLSSVDNQNYQSASKSLAEIITQKKKLQEISLKEKCQEYYSDLDINNTCTSQWRILRDSKILFENQDGLKKIFIDMNNDIDYEGSRTLYAFVNDIVTQIREMK